MARSEEQEEFIQAVKTVKYGKLLCLFGGAGTGKSYVIQGIKEEVPNVIIACPTGQAASIVGGTTIHSLFGIPTGVVINPDFKARPIQTQRFISPETRFYGKTRTAALMASSWLILDEISMVRCDHLDFINETCKRVKGNLDVPFGGMGVILVGDPGQLPCVATKEEIYQLEEYGYEYPCGFRESRTWTECTSSP